MWKGVPEASFTSELSASMGGFVGFYHLQTNKF